MAHEFDGKQYAQASTHQKEWGLQLIDQMHLRGDEHLLDLGCGDGSLTQQIAQRLPNGRVLGIDASRGMIDTALPKSTGNLHFQLLDIDCLNFDGQFDLVFSNAALHWVKNHRAMLCNVRRALRPNGRLRFNFAGDGNCSHFFQVVRQTMGQEEFAQHFSSFTWPWYMPTVAEYTALAESCGFAYVNVWGENADRYFPDSNAMIRWLDQPSLVPLLPFLPKEKQSSFREAVIKGMLAVTQEADGRCFETFRRINLAAQK